MILSDTNNYVSAIGQVVQDNSIHTGIQTLELDLKIQKVDPPLTIKLRSPYGVSMVSSLTTLIGAAAQNKQARYR